MFDALFNWIKERARQALHEGLVQGAADAARDISGGKIPLEQEALPGNGRTKPALTRK